MLRSIILPHYFKYSATMLSMLLFFVAIIVKGQTKEKKFLTGEDYGLWGKVAPKLLSDDGQWASYDIHYESNEDTLFLRNTTTFKTHAFPKGRNGKFSAENTFAYLSAPGVLELIDLKTGKNSKYFNVLDYSFISNNSYLMITIAYDDRKTLLICNTNGAVLKKFESITTYAINRDESTICLLTNTLSEASVKLIHLNKNFSEIGITDQPNANFDQIRWSKNGKALCFYGTFSGNTIPQLYYYNLLRDEVLHFKDGNIPGFPQDMLLSGDASSFNLSDDGSSVFLKIFKNAVAIVKIDSPMVYHATEDLLFSEKKQLESRDYYGVWSPLNNRFLQITSDSLPRLVLSGNQSVALVSELKQIENNLISKANTNYYLMNLDTGDTKKILSSYDGTVFASPGGIYFCYFKDHNWWTYNIAHDVHTNITQSIKTTFTEQYYVASESKESYGIGGWTLADESLLVYDKYDVWKITPDGLIATRLTTGREFNMIFRIATLDPAQRNSTNYSSFTNGSFDLTKNLYLQCHSSDYNISGYYYNHPKKGLQTTVIGKKQIDYLMVSKSGSTLLYREQSFDLPPQLLTKSTRSIVPKQLYQSNIHQGKYFWGTAKSFSYNNSTKDSLQGILFYPANYDPKKEYPMVVQIYEKLSYKLHLYVNPSYKNPTGFNVSNLTAQGYFVLFPDIIYREGEVGASALDCVTSAVDAALLRASISPKRIGLIGHSFGGFETKYIVSHSDRFAAAVAGAAVTDLVSFYLQLNGATGKSNFWRFELQQFRMGKSLFEDEDRYLNNSPVLYAKNVQTPLLSWSGDADTQVHYFQTLEFFQALKRLKKPHTMLLYPNESHILEQEHNQRHLTKYIENWFTNYLKKDAKVIRSDY